MRYFFIQWLLPCWLNSFLLAQNPLPNIILIIVDDLGYADVSHVSWHSDDVQTPNIDRLAQEGTFYTNAYSTSPICNASRIALATGSYQQRNGSYWYQSEGLPEFPTIAELLKTKDYQTAYIGKVHHGANDRAGMRGHPLEHGFDEFFGFFGGTKHYLKHKQEYRDEVQGRDFLGVGPLWEDNEQIDIEGFTTELFTERAVDFINRNQQNPFFLTLSHNAVHNYTHQLPPDYLESRGIPAFEDYDSHIDNIWEWRAPLSYPNHPHGRDYYLGQLHLMDEQIGVLLDKLESLKLTKNTIIFFVNDNGGSLVTYAKNAPLTGGKYTLLEGGIRIPMIAINKNYFKQGSEDAGLRSAMDILPTICDILSIDEPTTVDGRSLLSAGHQTLFWDTGHQQAVRSKNWKLLVTQREPNSRLQITETPNGTFLYDLNKDKSESIDISPEQQRIKSQLLGKLSSWQATFQNP